MKSRFILKANEHNWIDIEVDVDGYVKTLQSNHNEAELILLAPAILNKSKRGTGQFNIQKLVDKRQIAIAEFKITKQDVISVLDNQYRQGVNPIEVKEMNPSSLTRAPSNASSNSVTGDGTPNSPTSLGEIGLSLPSGMIRADSGGSTGSAGSDAPLLGDKGSHSPKPPSQPSTASESKATAKVSAHSFLASSSSSVAPQVSADRAEFISFLDFFEKRMKKDAEDFMCFTYLMVAAQKVQRGCLPALSTFRIKEMLLTEINNIINNDQKFAHDEKGVCIYVFHSIGLYPIKKFDETKRVTDDDLSRAIAQHKQQPTYSSVLQP